MEKVDAQKMVDDFNEILVEDQYIVELIPGENLRLIRYQDCKQFIQHCEKKNYIFEARTVIEGTKKEDLQIALMVNDCMQFYGDLFLVEQAYIFRSGEKGEIKPLTYKELYEIQQSLEETTYTFTMQNYKNYKGKKGEKMHFYAIHLK